MTGQIDSSWSVREKFTVDDAHPDSMSSDGSLHNERLDVRFRAWKRTFIIFGVITSILVVVVFIGLLFMTQPTVTSPYLGGGASSPGTASSSPGTAAAPSSQTAQTLAVAGLIIGCISAVGTLLSGWGTLVTARAVARQDNMASRVPKARARSSKPRTRKV